MDVVSNSDCQSEMNAVILAVNSTAPTVNIPDTMVCAKGSTGNQSLVNIIMIITMLITMIMIMIAGGQGGDPCFGDQGTSLVAQKSGDEGFSLVGN